MPEELNPSEKLALCVTTFDAEHLMQITQVGQDGPFVTIGEPAGPGGTIMFCVWEGSGLDADDNETEAAYTFEIKHPNDPAEVSERWHDAVKIGYELAVNKMFEAHTTRRNPRLRLQALIARTSDAVN